MTSKPGEFVIQPDKTGKTDMLRFTRWVEAPAVLVVPAGPPTNLDTLEPPVVGRGIAKMQNLTGAPINYGYSTATTFELADRDQVHELVADSASIFVQGPAQIAYAQGVR